MNSIARWLQDRPATLEMAYRFTAALIRRIEPLLRRIGFQRLEGLFEWGERVSKGFLFDCRMCGMCNLRGTGMTCPMTCPKNLRNGPCGGVRQDGKCEIIPEMDCIWVLGWERAAKMQTYGERILLTHPPVDRSLEGSSAWLNILDGRDDHLPVCWDAEGPAPALIPLQSIQTIADE
jgi:hypothetical protein